MSAGQASRLMLVAACLFMSWPAPAHSVSEVGLGAWWSDHPEPRRSRSAQEQLATELEEEEGRENCTDINNPPPRYNGSMCQLVEEECDDKYELLNYLWFVVCGLGESLEALGFIMLGLWLLYLLSLLSTTVDTFFVPVLQMMANKLRLPPSIAGMTLLALGNGAPDIFVAFSALIKEDDLTLVLGALMGAGLFITTVVLGTVLMVAKSRQYNIDKIDFMRDIIAFMVVLALIVGVSLDGTVYAVEVALFPVTYIGYVVAVLAITFFRRWLWNKRHRVSLDPERVAFNKHRSEIAIREDTPPKHPGDQGPVLRWEIEKSTDIDESSVRVDDGASDSGNESVKIDADSAKVDNSLLKIDADSAKVDDSLLKIDADSAMVDGSLLKEDKDSLKAEESIESEPEGVGSEGEGSEGNEEEPDISENEPVALVCRRRRRTHLPGLSWPKGWVKRVQCVIEWPFSLLRWMTIPPCCHDGEWSMFHYCFAVVSPVSMSLLLMVVASEHWSVFEMTLGDSSFPVPVLVVLCVSPLCVPLLFLLSWKRPPHPVMQVVLMVAAFVMSICWLYLIADEVVSVLQALGLLASISTAILGLTVLAIGNSVADWVADTVVSLSGKPQMALASCFGAPLITHVMGLSFALLARMLADEKPYYNFDIFSHEFVHVKMAWIFLAFVLFGSAVIFPLFKFSPPREYGLVLMYVYLVFMVCSVLIETNIMQVFV